jgi:hypothetical protein
MQFIREDNTYICQCGSTMIVSTRKMIGGKRHICKHGMQVGNINAKYSCDRCGDYTQFKYEYNSKCRDCERVVAEDQRIAAEAQDRQQRQLTEDYDNNKHHVIGKTYANFLANFHVPNHRVVSYNGKGIMHNSLYTGPQHKLKLEGPQINPGDAYPGNSIIVAWDNGSTLYRPMKQDNIIGMTIGTFIKLCPHHYKIHRYNDQFISNTEEYNFGEYQLKLTGPPREFDKFSMNNKYPAEAIIVSWEQNGSP